MGLPVPPIVLVIVVVLVVDCLLLEGTGSIGPSVPFLAVLHSLK